MASQDLYDRVLELEESTWRALTKSGADMVPHLADDCIMQFPLGLKVSSKSDPSVHDILHSPAFVPWKNFQLKHVDVTPIGEQGAVISYLAVASRPPSDPKGDQEVPFEALCSSVWREEGDKWLMCFHQQTMAS